MLPIIAVPGRGFPAALRTYASVKSAMSLPEKIRVKLSSEAAGSISITPVVVQDLPARELIEHMLGITGKDAPRIRELLLRGTLVSGASRFRWQGFQAADASVEAMLATFPDPEPGRLFAAAQCTRAVLRGPRARVEIGREFAAKKPMLRRRSFWDELMEVAQRSAPRYADYSYAERADVYQSTLDAAAGQSIRTASAAVRYTTLRDQIRAAAFDVLELYLAR